MTNVPATIGNVSHAIPRPVNSLIRCRAPLSQRSLSVVSSFNVQRNDGASRYRARHAFLLFRSSIVGGAGEPFEEYAHLLRGLLIPATLGNADAAAISLDRLPRAAGIREDPAEQFPRGRIIGVLGHGNLGVLDGAVELPFGRIARREREAHRRTVPAARDQRLEILGHAH